MPWFVEGNDPRYQQGIKPFDEGAPPAPAPVVEKPKNFIDDTLPAVVRQQATYRGAVAIDEMLRGQGFSTDVDPAFDPMKTAKGTLLENQFDKLAGLTNQKQFDALLKREESIRADQENLAASGWPGYVAMTGLGLVDPGPWIAGLGVGKIASLGGIAFNGARMGAARGALTGAAMGATVAAANSAYDPNFTTKEAIESIAFPTLLGGAIGGGIGLLSKKQIAHIADQTEFDTGIRHYSNETGKFPKEEIAAAHAEMPRPPEEIKGASTTDNIIEHNKYLRQLEEWQMKHHDKLADVAEYARNLDAEPTAQAPGPIGDGTAPATPSEYIQQTADGVSLSAAANPDPNALHLGMSYEQMDGILGSNWLIRQMSKLHPLGRVLNSASKVARRDVLKMMETAREFKDAQLGRAVAEGGAIETQLGVQTRRYLTKANNSLRDNWLAHIGSESGFIAGLKADANNLFNNLPEGKLSYSEFKAEVDAALRNGDVNEAYPEAANVARDIRSMVNEITADLEKTSYADGTPMLNAYRSPPKGDISWWARMWNNPVIRARRTDFKNRITNWLMGEQATKQAAKERIIAHSDNEVRWSDYMDGLEGRLETINNRLKDTGIRISERRMANRDNLSGAERIKERQTIVDDTISELQQAIDFAKSELKDPDSLEYINKLESQLKEIRKEAAPMSEAEQARIEKAEIDSVLSGTGRKAARIVLGQQKMPKRPSLLSYIARNGGITDAGGDLKATLGKNVPVGFYRKSRDILNAEGKGADDWAVTFGEMAKEGGFGREEPFSIDEVKQILLEAQGEDGVNPEWWLEGQDHMRLQEEVDWLHNTLQEAGIKANNINELMDAIRYGEAPLLQRLQEKAQAAGEMGHLETALGRARNEQLETKRFIDRLIKDRNVREGEAKGLAAGLRGAETGTRKGMGRLGLLETRMDMQEQMRTMLENALAFADAEKQKARKALEGEVEAWEGNSSADAIRALRKRREAEAAREERLSQKEQETGQQIPRKRLKSADKEVNKAIRSIMESDRDWDIEQMADRADEIIDRILGMPDGRLPYDIASEKNATIFAKDNPARGSLRNRDFAIPTNLVKEFVNTDVEHVMASYLRTVLPDLELAKKFGGDVEMIGTQKEIAQEYNDMISTAAQKLSGKKLEKETLRLEKEKKDVIADVTAMRDRIRNTYGWSGDANEQYFQKLARNVRNYTTLTSLGSAAINSFSDFGGSAAIRYGLGRVFGDIYAPFAKSLTDANLKALTKKEAAEFGIGVETLLGHDRYDIADFVHSHMPEDKFSNGMSYAANNFHKLNLLSPYTDKMKLASFPIARGNFIRLSEKVAAGRGTQREISELANAGITPELARNIAKELEAHGVMEDGVKTSGIENWTDREARDAFANAVSREVNILVSTPSKGEVPLTASKWWGGILFQFKGYMFGANERLMIANLQRQDASIILGTMWMTALGSLSYAASQAAKMEPLHDDPLMILKEGVDRGTVVPVVNEIMKTASRATGGATDPLAWAGAKGPVSRRAYNSSFADVFGPAYSTGEHLYQFGKGVLRAGVGGEPLTRSELHHGRLGMAYNNIWAWRGLLTQVEEGIGDFGNLPKRRDHH